MPSHLASALISEGQLSPDLCRCALENGYYKNLAKNTATNIPEDVVAALWKKKLDAQGAVNLARRPVDPDTLRKLVAKERRKTVLVALMSCNVLDKDDQAALVKNPGYSTKVVVEHASKSWCDPTLRDIIWEKGGGAVKLEWLTDKMLDDEDGLRVELESFSSWVSDERRWKRNAQLSTILGRWPSLVKIATQDGAHEALRLAAAGCRHLRETADQLAVLDFENLSSGAREVTRSDSFIWISLANSPVLSEETAQKMAEYDGASTYELRDAVFQAKKRLTTLAAKPISGPYETETNPEVLSWLVRRSMPSDYKPAGRPWDLEALLKNEALDANTRKRIADVLGSNMDLFDEEPGEQDSDEEVFEHLECPPFELKEVSEYARKREVMHVNYGGASDALVQLVQAEIEANDLDPMRTWSVALDLLDSSRTMSVEDYAHTVTLI